MMKSNGVPTDWKSPAKDPRTRKKKGKEKTEKGGGSARVSDNLDDNNSLSKAEVWHDTHTHKERKEKMRRCLSRCFIETPCQAMSPLHHSLYSWCGVLGLFLIVRALHQGFWLTKRQRNKGAKRRFKMRKAKAKTTNKKRKRHKREQHRREIRRSFSFFVCLFVFHPCVPPFFYLSLCVCVFRHVCTRPYDCVSCLCVRFSLMVVVLKIILKLR